MKLHAFISGRVQGVFFRSSTRAKAEELGLRGWARNLADGRVEVMAEGDEESLKKLLKWLYKGPPDAVVKDVKYEFSP